jgi:hypothetical protein
MGIYANAERKNISQEELAKGGEAIITAPYFNAQGYSLIGFIAANDEHQYKVVKVTADYSLEPIGSLKLFESDFVSNEYKKINSSGTTTVSLTTPLFGFNLSSGSFVRSLGTSGVIVGHCSFSYSQLFNGIMVSVYSYPVDYSSFYINHFFITNSGAFFVTTESIGGFSFLVETNSRVAFFSYFSASYCIVGTSGSSWTLQSLQLSISISGAAASNDLFLIQTDNGTVYTSPNANAGTWINRGVVGYYQSNLVAFGLGYFAIITAINVVKISTDGGVSWVIKTIPTVPYHRLYFDKQRQVFILKTTYGYFYTTTDFEIFNQYYFPSNNNNNNVLNINNEVLILGSYNSIDLNCWQKNNINLSGFSFGYFDNSTPSLYKGIANQNPGLVDIYKYDLVQNNSAPAISSVITGTNYFLKEQ